jgi:hypothetical protein
MSVFAATAVARLFPPPHGEGSPAMASLNRAAVNAALVPSPEGRVRVGTGRQRTERVASSTRLRWVPAPALSSGEGEEPPCA